MRWLRANRARRAATQHYEPARLVIGNNAGGAVVHGDVLDRDPSKLPTQHSRRKGEIALRAIEPGLSF